MKPVDGDFSDTYVRYMIPGAIMLTIIAVGIPMFWFAVIWKNRDRLDVSFFILVLHCGTAKLNYAYVEMTATCSKLPPIIAGDF